MQFYGVLLLSLYDRLYTMIDILYDCTVYHAVCTSFVLHTYIQHYCIRLIFCTSELHVLIRLHNVSYSVLYDSLRNVCVVRLIFCSSELQVLMLLYIIRNTCLNVQLYKETK